MLSRMFLTQEREILEAERVEAEQNPGASFIYFCILEISKNMRREGLFRIWKQYAGKNEFQNWQLSHHLDTLILFYLV